MADTFHRYERKLERGRQLIQESDFSPANKRAILDFTDFCFSEGLSVARVEKYLGHVKCLALLVKKDFADATREDLETLVRLIQNSDYSEWTKHDLRVTLKKLYRWLKRTDEDPPETRWIRVGNPNSNKKLPKELLTEDDAAKLIDACLTHRDKALVAVLFETGCRIGEIASLRIKHVEPNRYGFRLIVSGKTGDRRVLVISSAAYLTDWLNDHPCKSDPEAYLWITSDFRAHQLSYARVCAMLRDAAKRAQVRKRVNPHTFRHSRATLLANSLTEAQMNEYFGWVQGSNMPSVYVHLSGRDVDNALLKTYGICPDMKESGQTGLKPRTCSRCGVQNAPTNRFCSRCGNILDEKTALEVKKESLDHKEADDVMDRLLQDREFRAVLDRKLDELSKSQHQN